MKYSYKSVEYYIDWFVSIYKKNKKKKRYPHGKSLSRDKFKILFNNRARHFKLWGIKLENSYQILIDNILIVSLNELDFVAGDAYIKRKLFNAIRKSIEGETLTVANNKVIYIRPKLNYYGFMNYRIVCVLERRRRIEILKKAGKYKQPKQNTLMKFL